jgi:hypothetical protein
MRKILAVLLILGACASEGEGGPKAAEPAVTTAPRENTTVPPDETTTTVPGAFPIGTRVETERGNFFTLYAYEQPVPPLDFFDPDPGNEYAAADIEFCRGVPVEEDEFLTGVGPGDYELQMGDNTRRSFDIGAREPQLNYTEVTGVGDCVRGWVTYQVPVGVRPAFLVVINTDPLVKFAL